MAVEAWLWIRRVYEIECDARRRTWRRAHGCPPGAETKARAEDDSVQASQFGEGHRIKRKSVGADTKNEVQRRLVKGYEFSKNRHLLLTEADYDSVEFSR